MKTIQFIEDTSHTITQCNHRLLIMQGAKIEGYTIVKHLPDSSVFRYRNGSWKDYWERESSKPFPQQSHCDCCFRDNGIELVGCHVIDKDNKVYIYPVCQSCNTEVIGHENDFPFYAKNDWLIPFRVEEAVCENQSESPSELLSKAISKISFD